MNDPRFEVYPQRHSPGHANLDLAGQPTGEFGWRFRAANGKISAVGGEGFTRREDAHRAVDDLCEALVPLVGADECGETIWLRSAIIDIDE